MSARDESLHVLDHLRHETGRTRFGRRRLHAERVIRLRELALVRRGPLPPGPLRFGGLAQDLVVDVGDVADEQDVVALVLQPAAQYVERDAAAHMTDVGNALHGCATQIDRHSAGVQRHEVAHLSSSGVM